MFYVSINKERQAPLTSSFYYQDNKGEMKIPPKNAPYNEPHLIQQNHDLNY